MLERLISLPPVSFCLEVWDTYARAAPAWRRFAKTMRPG